jgi:hypothetical protein
LRTVRKGRPVPKGQEPMNAEVHRELTERKHFGKLVGSKYRVDPGLALAVSIGEGAHVTVSRL